MAKTHTVVEGDCIASIAFENGFFPETIWNHPENRALKDKRKDMNILMRGDAVHVPDKRVKKFSAPVDGFYRFKYKGVPARLNLVISHYGQPCRSEPFKLEIDGRKTEGTTDAEGNISIPIAPDAKKGWLVVGEDGKQIEYVIDLGHLAPIDQVIGFKHRLQNIGYEVGELDDALNDEFKHAVRMFEAENDLDRTGEINDQNKGKLLEIYGR